MSLSLDISFDATYYTEADPSQESLNAGSSNPDCPAVWDVALAGHGYMLDLQANQQGGFRHESIPTLRPVFIEGDSLGEKDINPEDQWRFSDRDWSHGAGQRRADLTNSDTSMFWESKGIDPWTEWQASLLPDTNRQRVSANTNLRCLVAGSYLYVADGTEVRWTLDGVTFTNVGALPGGVITAITTDGYTVYIATANSTTAHISVYTTTVGATVAIGLVTGNDVWDTLVYANGRLMGSIGPSVYNITSAVAAAKPAALFTHPNPTFVWVGFAEGQQGIYAAGFAGVHTEIYRIGIDSGGVNLDVPILAAPDLLGGEIALSIGSYLGFVFLGTVTGVRMCIADSTGNLSVGALITTGPVRCFDGYDRFMWFGWDTYDTVSTGLGRLDVTVEATNGAPAYASDLMAPGQNPVTDVVTWKTRRWFAVSGQGFYQQSNNLVQNGYLDTGLITYDIPDDKIALSTIIRHGDPEGTIQAAIAVDGGQFTFIGSHDKTAQNDTYTIPQLIGETFELRITLSRDTTFNTLGPTVTRTTLFSIPDIDSGLFIYVPVMLSETVQVHGGGEARMDVEAERQFLYQLRVSTLPVIYQELGTIFNVTVDDLTWTPTFPTADYSAWNGTLTLKCKTL